MQSARRQARTSTTASRIGGRAVAPVAADDRAQDHAARRLPESQRPTASTARNVYNLYDNQFTTGAAGTDLGERKQYLQLREKFRDKTLLADLTGSLRFRRLELTSVTSYINRDILVSRDASALTGSVSVSVPDRELPTPSRSGRR